MAERDELKGDKSIDLGTFDTIFKNIHSPQEFSTLAETNTTQSSLTEEDLIDAIDALRGNRRLKRPMNDYANESWTLAAAIAFIKMFQLRMTIEEMNYLAGKSLRTELSFPLGRHQFTQQNAVVIDNEDRNKSHRLEYRVMMMEEILHKHFDVLEQWVDIAKRAKEDYTVEDILKIENIEQRMSALRIFGAEKLLEESHAKLISKSARGNELYRIPQEQGFFTEDAYFLKYKCVSTDRIYVSGVPSWLFNQQMAVKSSAIQDERNMGMAGYGIWWSTPWVQVEQKYLHNYHETEFADLAMAWKFNLTLEEYKALSRANEG